MCGPGRRMGPGKTGLVRVQWDVCLVVHGNGKAGLVECKCQPTNVIKSTTNLIYASAQPGGC